MFALSKRASEGASARLAAVFHPVISSGGLRSHGWPSALNTALKTYHDDKSDGHNYKPRTNPQKLGVH